MERESRTERGEMKKVGFEMDSALIENDVSIMLLQRCELRILQHQVNEKEERK